MTPFTLAIPFEQCTDWLADMEFSLDGDDVLIQAVRRSGYLLGEVRIPRDQFS